MKRAQVDVSVLTTGHDVADARLHRLVNVLAQGEGLTVEVHGLGVALDGPPEAEVQSHPRWGMGRRAVDALLLPWRSRGRVVLVLDPDLFLPTLLRRFFARWPSSRAAGRHVVVDVHEDYSRALADRNWARGARLAFARSLVAASTSAASRADLTVVADDHLPPFRAAHRLVVRNLPLRNLLPAPGPPASGCRALYVGDVRLSRGLRMMLSVLESCPDWTLDVVGPVATADREWLTQWRATSPARDRVRFHGRRPPREAWRFATGAWAGLCMLQPTPAFVAALPTKVLEYLACGLAVVTTPLPRTAALVRDTETGVVVDDVQAAVAVLQRWASDPSAVLAHQQAGQRWAESRLAEDDQYAVFGRAVSQLVKKEQV